MTTTKLNLRECKTVEEMHDRCQQWMDKRFGPKPAPRSVTRRPDGTRITDPGMVRAQLEWRKWDRDVRARSLAAVDDYTRRDHLAARAGRPEPRWTDARTPITVSYGDTTFEIGAGGCARRVTAPSHVPTAGAPRAVSRPALQSTAAERHARSVAAKARHAVREQQAATAQKRAQQAQARALEERHLRGRGDTPWLICR